MKRVAVVALLGVLALFAPMMATAKAASDPVYVNYEGDWAGYVTLNGASLNSREMTVDVTIQATKGRIPVNPLYFIAKAPDGTTYEYSWTGDSTLHSGELPAGQKTRGTVVLDVAGGPEPNQLIYEGPLGEQLASWTIRWKKAAPRTTPERSAPFGSTGS